MAPSFLSIVIPVYDEQDNLADLHAEIRKVMESSALRYEAIYVDDGSRDDSWNRLVALHQRHPGEVRLIRLRRNFGQTAALAAGFDAASGDLVIPMDADLQNDPSDIPAMIERMNAENCDVVSGWRAKRQDPFLTRRLPSALANSIISRITGVRLHDYGCTLKVYRRAIVRDLRLYGEMHRFLPALAVWAGAKVTEMPVHHRPRTRGRAKYGLSRTLRVILDLITVKFLLSYSTRPMQVFGKWGFISMMLGTIAGLVTAYQKFFPPHLSANRNGWLFLSTLFLIAGIQMICMGLLGEINVRTYYETQQKPIYMVAERVGLERQEKDTCGS
jgi:glycosyltransferase involved in cell wall biosynthesis